MSRINKRFEVIGELVDGKTVLDVGCVAHLASRADQQDWLHVFICARADSVVGLDFAEKEAEKLNRRGYDIRTGNAETIDLGQAFDCVVAGELIEHLDNPGLFLRNMWRHLRPGGTIALTTPNPFYPKRLFEIMLNGKAEVHPQHTMWLCPDTLESLLRRAAFERIDIIPFSNSEACFRIGRIPGNLWPWLHTNLLALARRPA